MVNTPNLLDTILSYGPRLQTLSAKKRIFQVRFGDGKIKTIIDMEQDPVQRALFLYIRKFPFGVDRIRVPMNQLFGWNQNAMTAKKYCFDCPLYNSKGDKIKVEQGHILWELANRVDELEKDLQQRDDRVILLQYELDQIRGTTDEAVGKRIAQIAKLSEAHAKGQGKRNVAQQIPYPMDAMPTNLTEGGED